MRSARFVPKATGSAGNIASCAVTGDGAFLRDLGSKNGTLVNGTLITEEHPLKHGDRVQLGPLVFEVRLSDEPLPGSTDPTVDSAADPTVEKAPVRADPPAEVSEAQKEPRTQ